MVKDKELVEKLEALGFTNPDIQQVKTLLGTPEVRVISKWLGAEKQSAVEGLLRSSPDRVLQDQGKAAAIARLRDNFERAVEIIGEE